MCFRLSITPVEFSMLANARCLVAVLVLTLVASLASPVVAQPAPTPGGTTTTSETLTATVEGNAVLVPPENTTVNVAVAGKYDMKGFGKVKLIKVQVRYKHPGETAWSELTLVKATVADPNAFKGTYTAVVKSVPYVTQTGKKTDYQVKSFLYQDVDGSETVVGSSSGWYTVGSP
jgi:hypothetical protein